MTRIVDVDQFIHNTVEVIDLIDFGSDIGIAIQYEAKIADSLKTMPLTNNNAKFSKDQSVYVTVELNREKFDDMKKSLSRNNSVYKNIQPDNLFWQSLKSTAEYSSNERVFNHIIKSIFRGK